MTKCCLCGLEKPLINAHIIPRKFYNPIKELYENGSQGDKVPRVYSKDTKSKQWQSGVFDSNILCKECDGKIGIWDNYAQNLLLKQHKEFDVSINKRYFIQIENFNYQLLKLFFMSVLFRCAITTDSVFSSVSIGQKWYDILKKMILENNAGTEHDFSVLLFKYEGDESKFVMTNPERKRTDGINCYRIILGCSGYGFIIKVDQRKFDNNLKILCPNQPLYLYVKDIKDTNHYRMLLQTSHQLMN